MKEEIQDRINKINNGVVPKGYKKSKLGIIPENWQIKYMKELFDFKNGVNASKEKYGTGVKFINTLEVLNNSSISYSDIKGSVEVSKSTLEKNAVRKGDVLFNRTSETAEEIAKAAVYTGEKTVIFGGFIIRATEKGDNFDINYKKYAFNTNLVRKEFIKRGQGISRINIGQNEMGSVPVLIFSKKEQEKIAEILMTWDNAIEQKELLLKECKKFKKGLMQKLFTREIRLDGFRDDWKEVKLKELSEVKTGTTPPTKEDSYYNGEYPWVTPTDINYNKYITKTERTLTEKGLKKGRYVPKNSLLVTCIASIGKNCIITSEGSCNQQINAILPSKYHSNEFLYYLIEQSKNYLLSFAGTTATNIINKREFENLKFDIPSNLKEQEAIADILSTQDELIEAIENEIDLLKKGKKGLMELLLTGKLRVDEIE